LPTPWELIETPNAVAIVYYAGPWLAAQASHLRPGWEPLEFICGEHNKDIEKPAGRQSGADESRSREAESVSRVARGGGGWVSRSFATGRRVDREGPRVDREGRRVDREGPRVDREGPHVDREGLPESRERSNENATGASSIVDRVRQDVR
jgi:hypothetical protein